MAAVVSRSAASMTVRIGIRRRVISGVGIKIKRLWIIRSGVRPLAAAIAVFWMTNDLASKPDIFRIAARVVEMTWSSSTTNITAGRFCFPFQMAGAGDDKLPMQYASFEVRTKGDPPALEQTVRRAMKNINSGFRVNDVMTEEELVQGQLLRERLLAMLAEFFASVALLLAAIGLYVLLHYSVVQREREIGLRIALGAG